MTRTVVLNVVGLTPGIVRSAAAPNLARWAAGAALTRIRPAFPAVTCTAQSDYLTGRYPTSHGIVGNGWYAREDAEIQFWKQSNKLVQRREDLGTREGDRAGVHLCQPLLVVQHVFDRGLQRHAAADVSRRRAQAPRRLHASPAICATSSSRSSATFPLFSFWGPRPRSSRREWIAESAKHVEQKFSPDAIARLSAAPRLQPAARRAWRSGGGCRRAADRRAVRRSHRLLRGAWRSGRHPLGVRLVRRDDARAHQPRAAGAGSRHRSRRARPRSCSTPARARRSPSPTIRSRTSTSTIRPASPGPCARSRRRQAWRTCSMPKASGAQDRPRARRRPHRDCGAEKRGSPTTTGSTTQRAPDFARTVDIHRKPGYDPVELFLDPAIRVPALTVGCEARQEESRVPRC